mmetsp:Transcript_45318/g.92548  ORF Transcript_45318/g.92548 Transcript_45318/m.92548 type:complete len:227 (-) Transcript_45318:9933-10613(-)
MVISIGLLRFVTFSGWCSCASESDIPTRGDLMLNPSTIGANPDTCPCISSSGFASSPKRSTARVSGITNAAPVNAVYIEGTCCTVEKPEIERAEWRLDWKVDPSSAIFRAGSPAIASHPACFMTSNIPFSREPTKPTCSSGVNMGTPFAFMYSCCAFRELPSVDDVSVAQRRLRAAACGVEKSESTSCAELRTPSLVSWFASAETSEAVPNASHANDCVFTPLFVP